MNSRIQEQRQCTPQQHPAVGREELLRRQESKLTNSSEFKKSYNVTVKGRSGRPNLNMKCSNTFMAKAFRLSNQENRSINDDEMALIGIVGIGKSEKEE